MITYLERLYKDLSESPDPVCHPRIWEWDLTAVVFAVLVSGVLLVVLA